MPANQMNANEWSVVGQRPDPEPEYHPDLPQATVGRLASYRAVLDRLLADDIATVRSSALAEAAGVNSAQLRKDLSLLGSYGVRGVGYDVTYLREQLRARIGDHSQVPLVIVGAGNLGRALANHAGFGGRGFQVIGLFDVRPEPGTFAMADLADVVVDPTATIGVIATPAQAAQPVADQLVEVGLRSLLNFAPIRLIVPAEVMVRRVDLGSELEILAYHRQTSHTDGAEMLQPSSGPKEGG